MSTGSATAMPASGPAAPMSSSASRERICPRIRITAPMVPSSEMGIGMKKGGEMSTPCSLPAK